MLDTRVIKCSCGNPNCIKGLSFDLEDENSPLLVMIYHKQDGSIEAWRLNKEGLNNLIEYLRNAIGQLRDSENIKDT